MASVVCCWPGQAVEIESCEDDSREHERIGDLARPPSTGESHQSNDIMHCAFGVNLLHTSNIQRSCDHIYSGPAGRSQFLFIVKGVIQ
jgi:hypothetical protein